MVMSMRKKPHSGEFKFKVAVAALKGDKTTAELCQEFGIVSSQLHKWKKMVLEQGANIFKEPSVSPQSERAEIDKLHATIGRLKVENDFLEKVLGRFR
jgi:transposase